MVPGSNPGRPLHSFCSRGGTFFGLGVLLHVGDSLVGRVTGELQFSCRYSRATLVIATVSFKTL